jgi:cell wall-associated NlpC family hydrolase
VRAEPRDDAEQVTQALLGEPLHVIVSAGGWARIETLYGYPGWIREDALGEHTWAVWPRPVGKDVLTEARAYLGAPYEWGGMSERGIDCSGLIHMAFRRVGILVPRDSWQQGAHGEEVEEKDLRPGDILWYEGHTAFWAGDGKILHADGHEDVRKVVEEPEPPELAATLRSRRRFLAS